MSRLANNKPAAPRKSGNPMLTGILIGMIIGVSLAAVLAWLILRSPSPFVNKEQVVKPTVETDRPAVEMVKPKAQAPVVAASGVDEARPRFEFYKVLTDKQDATPAAASAKPAEKPKAAEIKQPATNKGNYLQAGAFSNPADAENLKVKVTLLGMEVNVQTVAIPGKGEMHRVRVGPFQNKQDMDDARGRLKLNGMDATPTP